jgi:hypothetical protein
VDERFQIISIEVKDKNAKFTLKICGIYRTPNDDVRFIKRMATRTDSLDKRTTQIRIGGDSNLHYTGWKGNVNGLEEGRYL